MDLDAPICLCFNVSRRKILRFIKVEKPRRASQLSECFGAGTGCGWCRPILERLNQQHSVLAQSPDQFGAKNRISPSRTGNWPTQPNPLISTWTHWIRFNTKRLAKLIATKNGTIRNRQTLTIRFQDQIQPKMTKAQTVKIEPVE